MKFSKRLFLILISLSAVSMCLFGCTILYNYQDKTKARFYEEGDSVFRVGETNNGVEKYSEEMDRLTAVTPSDRQLGFLEMEYYNFIHFGMNTMTGKEWGDGTESPSLFNPVKLDTDQWCQALKASGSKGIILTAKHHDGFCLWQTETTEHSVKNSPYKNGKGDVVAELSASCKKYGLKLGIYLSPWDRNASSYGTPAYDRYFIEQLTELCTRYGELFSLWFDGANGGDAKIEYQWDDIYAVIRELQPNAVINIMGPDVRWVGNEAGVARSSEWCVNGGLDPDKVAEISQKNPEMAAKLQNVKYDSEDIGSRDILAACKDLRFYPAEADVSIRTGWFYHKNQSPKSLQQLLKIYYKTVGGNCAMLLNVPPNKDGLIDNKDVTRLKEFGDAVAKNASKPVSYNASVGTVGNMTAREGISAIYTENADSFALSNDETVIDLKLDGTHTVSMISMREDLRSSERIERYDVYIKSGNRWKLVSNATNVGNRRTVVISNANKAPTDAIRIVIRQSRKNPVIRSIIIYK